MVFIYANDAGNDYEIEKNYEYYAIGLKQG